MGARDDQSIELLVALIDSSKQIDKSCSIELMRRSTNEAHGQASLAYS
jgi:hypothetical protein